MGHDGRTATAACPSAAAEKRKLWAGTNREAPEEQAALIKALRISKLKWMFTALAGMALAGYLGLFR